MRKTFVVESVVNDKVERNVVQAHDFQDAISEDTMLRMFDKDGNIVAENMDIKTVGVYEVGGFNHLDRIRETNAVRDFYTSKFIALGIDPVTFQPLGQAGKLQK